MSFDKLPTHLNNILSTSSVGGVSVLVASHRFEGEAPNRTLILDIQVSAPVSVDVWPIIQSIVKKETSWGGGEILSVFFQPFRAFGGLGGTAIVFRVRIRERAEEDSPSPPKEPPVPLEAVAEASEEEEPVAEVEEKKSSRKRPTRRKKKQS